jgi:hypothetical protein
MYIICVFCNCLYLNALIVLVLESDIEVFSLSVQINSSLSATFSF